MSRKEQRLARERAAQTGQSYTAALRDIRREYEELKNQEKQ